MATSNDYICGINPVLEQLKNSPEKIDKIYIRKNTTIKNIETIQNLASANRIPVINVPGSKISELSGDVNSQGIVASVSQIRYQSFTNWLDTSTPDAETAILLLDEIEDPHNLGAILRTAAAAGIAAVLVPKHRQAPVSAAVMKTSAGTAGRIPIVRIGNLNQTISELKDLGFWVAGLDQTAGSRIWDQTYDVPMAFIIGNEGRGMRKKTSEHCDFLLSIPMKNDVESLNASVSASLVCYEWRRQKEMTQK